METIVKTINIFDKVFNVIVFAGYEIVRNRFYFLRSQIKDEINKNLCRGILSDDEISTDLFESFYKGKIVSNLYQGNPEKIIDEFFEIYPIQFNEKIEKGDLLFFVGLLDYLDHLETNEFMQFYKNEKAFKSLSNQKVLFFELHQSDNEKKQYWGIDSIVSFAICSAFIPNFRKLDSRRPFGFQENILKKFDGYENFLKSLGTQKTIGIENVFVQNEFKKWEDWTYLFDTPRLENFQYSDLKTLKKLEMNENIRLSSKEEIEFNNWIKSDKPKIDPSKKEDFQVFEKQKILEILNDKISIIQKIKDYEFSIFSLELVQELLDIGNLINFISQNIENFDLTEESINDLKKFKNILNFLKSRDEKEVRSDEALIASALGKGRMLDIKYICKKLLFQDVTEKKRKDELNGLITSIMFASIIQYARKLGYKYLILSPGTTVSARSEKAMKKIDQDIQKIKKSYERLGFKEKIIILGSYFTDEFFTAYSDGSTAFSMFLEIFPNNDDYKNNVNIFNGLKLLPQNTFTEITEQDKSKIQDSNEFPIVNLVGQQRKKFLNIDFYEYELGKLKSEKKGPKHVIDPKDVQKIEYMKDITLNIPIEEEMIQRIENETIQQQQQQQQQQQEQEEVFTEEEEEDLRQLQKQIEQDEKEREDIQQLEREIEQETEEALQKELVEREKKKDLIIKEGKQEQEEEIEEELEEEIPENQFVENILKQSKQVEKKSKEPEVIYERIVRPLEESTQITYPSLSKEMQEMQEIEEELSDEEGEIEPIEFGKKRDKVFERERNIFIPEVRPILSREKIKSSSKKPKKPKKPKEYIAKRDSSVFCGYKNSKKPSGSFKQCVANSQVRAWGLKQNDDDPIFSIPDAWIPKKGTKRHNVYCGIKKSKKPSGSFKECLDNRQIRLYGLRVRSNDIQTVIPEEYFVKKKSSRKRISKKRNSKKKKKN